MRNSEPYDKFSSMYISTPFYTVRGMIFEIISRVFCPSTYLRPPRYLLYVTVAILRQTWKNVRVSTSVYVFAASVINHKTWLL